jgi:hypothetical protein
MTAAIFGFCAGIIFTLGVVAVFRLPFWPWCLVVLPAQAVVQLIASTVYLFIDEGPT